MSTQQTIQNNLTALGFVNPSATAVENEIAQSLGVIVDNTITEIANSETYILAAMSSQNYGKPGYYTAIALAFQYGYSLTANNSTSDIVVNGITIGPGGLYYAVSDPTAQIIAQAAFVVAGSGLYIKVATLSGGVLVALSSIQLAAFTSYFLNFQIAGLAVSVISSSANILNFNAVATYSISYDLPTLQTNISNALTTFQDTFLFNGILYITQLEAYMVANVPGLISFFTSSQTIDSAPISGGSAALSSGYFDYNPAILTQITYNGV